MEHVIKTPTNPQLSARLRSDWLAGILRVDAIRGDTLVQLVKHWDETSREEIIDALDDLAEVVARGGHPDAVVAAVEVIEDVSAMEAAEEELSMDCVRRLRKELDAVEETLTRFERIEHP